MINMIEARIKVIEEKMPHTKGKIPSWAIAIIWSLMEIEKNTRDVSEQFNDFLDDYYDED